MAKKMNTDNMLSMMAAEKAKKRSKIEYDEKKMITDSALLMAGEKMNISETESGRLRRSWSDLPTDMVRIILRELPSFTDRIHARAVCKNWLLPLNEIPPRSSSSEFPLLMLLKWDFNTDIRDSFSPYKLFDPLYRAQNSKDEKFHNMMYYGTQVSTSKNGWVMFYHLSIQRNEPKFTQTTSFFVYNPFTKHTITLPDLIATPCNDLCCNFDIATFSSSPEEDGCVFFLARRKQKQSIFIATYRRSIMEQQQKWKTDEFKNGNGMITYDPIQGSVYIDGIFYLVLCHGTLLSFNVALHKCINLTTLCPTLNDKHQPPYLLELNGELLLVYGFCALKRLYVFDHSNNVWVRREDGYLKDRALTLFLSTFGSFAVKVDGADDDQNEIANMAYYSDLEHTTRCYSFSIMGDNWKEKLRKFGSEVLIIWIQPPSKF